MALTHYSVRWTGQVQASATGLTTFSTVSDDGVRLIFNGTTIINDWTDHAARTDTSGPVSLIAGQKYNVELDYFQGIGNAVIQLFWSSPTLAKQIIPASQLYLPTPVAPASTATTPDWFAQHLLDPALQSLVRNLDSEGSLSRADMLRIFSSVETGSVTATELTDLRTLVSNAGYLGMPAYVSNLANKVVNGDPANLHYQGQVLGNLYGGSSALQLQELVDKWFLGMDHPAVNAAGLTYTLAAGTLFGTGVNFADVKQGEVSDCYFVAALADIAYRSPATIQTAFIDNGDGTFTARFWHNGVADYVTVDRYLPTTSWGVLWYAGMGWSAANTGNKLWAPLLEKAYAQLAESGWSRGPNLANAYASISNGWEGTVLQQVANRVANSAVIVNSATTLNTLATYFQAGRMLLLDSKAATASGIVPNHDYVVVGYNATTQVFDLYNVWGYHQFLSWTQIAANFGSFCYTI
jgi:hypothetical protein